MMPAIFACSLACTVLFAVFAGPAIRKNPWVCYVPAVVLMAMYWVGAAGMLPQGLREIAFLLMQKGTLAMALFTVVMFVGVFPRGSKARLRLGAARAELSIAACLMICGHMVAYAASYVPRAFTVGFSNPFVVAGLLLAVVLAVLTAVLGVTSLSRVKARMAAAAWTRVQKLAYVFYGASYAHVLAMLLPSALGGGIAALQGVVVYTTVFAAYAALRIARAVADRAQRSGRA